MRVRCDKCDKSGDLGNDIRRYISLGVYHILCYPCFLVMRKRVRTLRDAQHAKRS